MPSDHVKVGQLKVSRGANELLELTHVTGVKHEKTHFIQSPSVQRDISVLSTELITYKLATIKSFEADVRSPFIRAYDIRSDEGLTHQTSALKLFPVANLRYNSVDNTKLPWPSPTDAASQFS